VTVRLADLAATLASPHCAVPADFVARLPWVHRTGRPGRDDWKKLWSDGHLKAQDGYPPEQDAGHSPVVYVSLGYGAYPRGLFALLLGPEVEALDGRFTPFDSGGVLTGRMQRAGQDLAGDDAVRFWTSWLLVLGEVRAFCASWIAAHFDDPRDYLTLPNDAVPPYPLRHALAATLPRLAWTIEGQVRGNVGLEHLREVVCARRSLIEELPDERIELASYPPDEEEYSEDRFDRFIARQVIARVEGP
jgi:hypothetical protein